MVGLYQILAGNVITCLEPLLNCQCHNLQVLKDYVPINVMPHYPLYGLYWGKVGI